MGIISVISLILGIIRLIPTAITLIKEIIALIQSLNGGTYADKTALMGEFKDALKSARETRDVTALETFHKKLGGMCASGMCGLSAVRNEERGMD